MIKVIIILTKFIIASTIVLLMSSCNIKTNFGNGRKGNGKITTVVRTINADFSSIDVQSGIEVFLEQANTKFVSVEIDENLQKSLDTRIENGILIIELNENIDASKTIKVIIQTPNIDGLDASSSSKITGIGTFKGNSISIDASSAAEIEVDLKYDDVTLDAASSGDITVKGLALKLETSASSGSNIKAYELFANDVIADASSGGSVKVHPIVSLSGNASSGGDITYNIEPKSISKNESSGGNVGRE